MTHVFDIQMPVLPQSLLYTHQAHLHQYKSVLLLTPEEMDVKHLRFRLSNTSIQVTYIVYVCS